MYLIERPKCHFANKGDCDLGKKVTCWPCFAYIRNVPRLNREGHVGILVARQAGRRALWSLCVAVCSFLVAFLAFLVAVGVFHIPQNSVRVSSEASKVVGRGLNGVDEKNDNATGKSIREQTEGGGRACGESIVDSRKTEDRGQREGN